MKPVLTEEELFSPHLPKVVLNQQGYAMYFSRHPLPYQRNHERAGNVCAGMNAYLAKIGFFDPFTKKRSAFALTGLTA